MKIGISLPIRELMDDLGAVREFAQAAEELGYNHLRVPEQVFRPGVGPLHEPLAMMLYIAGITKTIELCPSVIVLPARQTVLVAKQAADLDVLSGGRLRLGIGIGKNEDEYAALGADFHNRGARCEEQMELMTQLWTHENIDFNGKWEQVSGGISPLPIQKPIPMWIGCNAAPVPRVLQRIGRQANGWFVLASPEEFPKLKAEIDAAATAAGRNPADIGREAGVAVVGPREAEWQQRVSGWRKAGLTHLCLRTLGGGLNATEHLAKMRQVIDEVPAE